MTTVDRRARRPVTRLAGKIDTLRAATEIGYCLPAFSVGNSRQLVFVANYNRAFAAGRPPPPTFH